MAISSIMFKYLNPKSAMDGEWEENKHHRADDGKFTSDIGRGKSKENDNDKGKKDKDGERDEMSEEQATKIVRRAFEAAKCELKGLKLVDHALHADVKEADEGSLEAINKYLTERGLKANIQDKTTYKIAEDGFDDIRVVDDPMLEVLVDLCEIDMLAKDLHYRAQGKPFYGIHLLSDLVHDISDDADDLNEVYYMGEKGEEPPERSYVAAKAAELVGNCGGEDAIIKALYEACESAVKAVENAKSKGVTGGTSSVLDDISKKSLQAKGLLMQTMKQAKNSGAIDALIAKGIYFKPDAKAQDEGTSEGAKKGWETRKHGGGGIGNPSNRTNIGGANAGKLKEKIQNLESRYPHITNWLSRTEGLNDDELGQVLDTINQYDTNEYDDEDIVHYANKMIDDLQQDRMNAKRESKFKAAGGKSTINDALGQKLTSLEKKYPGIGTYIGYTDHLSNQERGNVLARINQIESENGDDEDIAYYAHKLIDYYNRDNYERTAQPYPVASTPIPKGWRGLK